jgi:hypothetical protein
MFGLETAEAGRSQGGVRMRLAMLLLVALAMIVGRPASAGQIVTPMMTASNVGEGQSMECRVANVGTKTQSITVELINAETGEAVGSQTCDTAPGHEGCFAFAVCAAPDFVCRAYCRFVAKSVRRIRGSILLTPVSTGDALVALPAL